MTNANARTAASVSSASTSCLQVSVKARANFAGDNPTTKAARMAAMRQDVPEADSQLNRNTAAYALGCATTGGDCWTRLCKPGQLISVCVEFNFARIGPYPQSRTMTISSM